MVYERLLVAAVESFVVELFSERGAARFVNAFRRCLPSILHCARQLEPTNDVRVRSESAVCFVCGTA